MSLPANVDRDRLASEAVDYLADVIEEIVYGWLPEFLEGYTHPQLSMDWRVWREARAEDSYVLRIPGMGNPDWDDVYEEVARRDAVPVEQVKRNLDPDIWELWNLELEHRMRDMVAEGVIDSTNNFVTAGPIADCWGVRIEGEIEVEPLHDEIERVVYDRMDDVLNRVLTAEEMEQLPENNYRNDFVGIFLEELEEAVVPSYEDAFEYAELTAETIDKLNSLESWIYEIATGLESLDYWVDLILANEWHL